MKRTKSIWQEYQNPANWIQEYPECSMFSYLKQTAQQHPDYCAIEFEGKKITYKKLLEQIEDTAKALVANGIRKGDYISIISINTPQALLMIYAANRIGAIANMIHPLLSPSEIEMFIENTNSSAILILEQVYQKIAKIKWKNNIGPKIILTRIIDALPLYIKPIYAASNRTKTFLNPAHDTVYWNEFLATTKNKQVNLPEDEGQADDTAIIMYSGGTTGTPKGVMLTNLNFNSYAIQAYDVSGVDNLTGKKAIAVLPLFHGFGLATGIHSTLCKGVHVYLIPKFDFKKSVDLIFKKKINCIYAVPALFEVLLRSPLIEKKELSFFLSLVSGGDKLQDKLYRRLDKTLRKGNAGTVFCDGYGQTECVAGCITNPYFAVNPKSVGIPQPDMLAKIVKPGTQIEVPHGVDGELCICGPTVMKGYYKNEEETKMALQVHEDGKTWLHTGDMFCVDDDGYFYFRQRISRMIISAGYNIYVTQVEAAITSCSAVSQCCVIGVKDRVLGQKIRAHVVLNDSNANKEVVRSKIMEQCKKQLAEYSQPHEIRFCESLPLTNLGKVDFKVLENEK